MALVCLESSFEEGIIESHCPLYQSCVHLFKSVLGLCCIQRTSWQTGLNTSPAFLDSDLGVSELISSLHCIFKIIYFPFLPLNPVNCQLSLLQELTAYPDLLSP